MLICDFSFGLGFVGLIVGFAFCGVAGFDCASVHCFALAGVVLICFAE